MGSMHRFLFLFYWTVGLLHAHINEDLLLTDDGFLSTHLGSISPSDDSSGLWLTHDQSSDNSLATALLAEDNIACPASTGGFFVGRKRIRSIICPGDQSAGDDQIGTGSDEQAAPTDPDLDDIIKDLEMPWKDDLDSAVADYDGEIQRSSICPDPLNLGHLLPVCSSGDKKDVSYAPISGEVKLEWCTLGMYFINRSCMFLQHHDAETNLW